MTTQEFLMRVWEMLIGRVDSAMPTRIMLQPALAVTFAIRAALRDYKGKKATFFFWSGFSDSNQRPEIFRKFRRDVGSVFFMALFLDVIYQLWDFHRIYPGQAVVVATALSLIPYLLIRGSVTRILQVIPSNSYWFYIGLLGMQTTGIIILFWNGLPLYRKLLADPEVYDQTGESRIWALSSIALIQIGYWIRLNLRPPQPNYYNPFLGHILSFTGRMSFVLATAIFSFVFIQAKLGDKMVFARNLLAIAAVFSIYCYMLELRGLGQKFNLERKPEDPVSVPATEK